MLKKWNDLLKEAFDDQSLVQSFSGVRTRLGNGPDISEVHEVLANAYGLAYGRFVAKNCDRMRLLIARDPRPTGPVLALALARGFLAAAKEANREVSITDLGIFTTPLAENAVRALNADGGVMITASHNPLVDNGWKFMTGETLSNLPGAAPTGALLSANQMAEVVESVQKLSETDELGKALEEIPKDTIVAAMDPARSQTARAQTLSYYVSSIEEDWGIEDAGGVAGHLGPCLVDPNGGAASQLAAQVLARLGMLVIEEPSVLGWPQHPIDTDGIDPKTGQHVLLRVANDVRRREARFGLAFDYDADRGNLVLPEEEHAVVRPQIVSALNVGLTLARRTIYKISGEKVAVVASDGTSVLTEEIVRAFGAKLVRVETGEINVVTRMRQLREEGYDVPIGVEGSNGGTIFGHATCRDGILTALSAASAEIQPDEVAELCKRLGQKVPAMKDQKFRLLDIIEALPSYTTLSDKLKGKPISAVEVKAAVEKCFTEIVWPRISSRYNGYQFINYEGTRVGATRTGDETGGWVVEIAKGNEKGFIFLRGSRTEAGMWRIIADSKTDEQTQEFLEIGREVFAASQID